MTSAVPTSHPPVINAPGGSSGNPVINAPPRSPHSSMSPVASPQQNVSPGSPRHQSGTIDAETYIRNHGGDLRRTIDSVVNDRNQLQGQNTQLWRLIEKQRAQCAHLAADNDRLRQDRERANQRLIQAGLEPVAGARRGVSHSVSAMTLMSGEGRRQNNSDQEDNGSAKGSNGPSTSPVSVPNLAATARSTSPGESQVNSGLSSGWTSSAPPQQPEYNPSSLAPSALPPPAVDAYGGLLPSPLPERRLRHESRMTFPPEVASFMALADTPRDGTAEGSTPSPGDSARGSPAVEPIFENSNEDPRPSQDTIPFRPVLDQQPSNDSVPSNGNAIASPSPAPDHTQLTPALLPHAHLSIPHSTVFPNQNGRDVLCFIIAINIRPPNNATPLSWTVGKTFSAFMDLDARSQERSGKNRKEWKRMVASLPEGKAWKDFAPSKIDQRKVALEQYLESLLLAPTSDKSDLCNFLTTDVVQAKTNKNREEGYLTKKGKPFKGWKTRYYVLDGSVMKCFESRGGPLISTLQIAGAQIGRGNRATDNGDERDGRHAFLIIEASKKDSSTQNRHVLCASSDAERDSWIEMLSTASTAHTQQASSTSQNGPPPAFQNAAARELGHQRRRSAIRKSSKDVVVTSAQPMSSLPDAQAKFISGAPLPSVINLMESQRQLHSSSTTDLLYEAPTPKPAKRQSAMPGRQSFSPAYLTKLSNDGISSVPGYPAERDRERKAKSGRFWGFGKTIEKAPAKPVFGVPLNDSIAVAQVAGLPAIVFRCIEYLEAKHADQEEGIYRLSGSSAVIKGLKEKFNAEGDVNLLAIDERWDPHAIAGLLKTYMRELPTSLLTRELHLRFLDLIDPAARVAELSRLVTELPPSNYTLLRAFISHLILIVKNAAVNKMTLRNIGIVFSPTLGIPAGIFYELVSRFGAIFDDAGVEELPLDGPAPATLGVPEGEDAAAGTNLAKRNSMLYHQGGADTLLGLGGRALDPATEDSTSELSLDDLESEQMSAQSSDNLSVLATPDQGTARGRRDMFSSPRNDQVEVVSTPNGA
ncbi:signal transducer [Trichosporon asahii var. asahii CBS 2479]|uniref:Signal transducer n=1 Tax=Trichosporon asahii var. asahii (strain ATCC 90039 / CBS 2479 / JCM 2466 / KCTC 7840 / NBRC 103889/ NCYC 2677 / UAMH 7654) TaxID=1186058 RepID=J5QFZ8_TRIAS|nr:signal transducer [Trichosporon asahii var. asahii CBS 2479]EJT47158.1 signal transducer [Trichosporon asahii var. asahii CBS 2479]